jgi:hypothetical protein
MPYTESKIPGMLQAHFIAAVFTVARGKSNASIHQWINGKTKCSVHIE